MAKIKGITVQIGADTKGLEAALKDVNQTAGKLRSELREVERLLKFNPRDTELLAQKQKLLTDQVENTRAKLQQLRDVQEQVNEQFKKGEIGEEQYRAFQRELIKTESQLKEYEKALKEVNLQNHEFNQKMQEMGDKLKKAGESMVATGKTLSTHLTVPLTALGTLAAKSAIDFESAFAGVRKTVHATEAEFAALERGIRDMAKEIPAAATEIAGVAEAAGQLGIQNEHILSFTRTMIDLGESTNMSAEQAATALARLANITQMPQSEFDRLGSTIVALGNNLATTEAEIVEMSLRLAGAGKQVGMTEAEILSFAGALSSVGIAAEAGGSAFSKVMIQMQLATETGGAALDNFARVAGMSAEQFARQFRENAAEALIAFINGLQRAEEQGTSAIKVLDDIGITEVRMRDALLRAAGAGDLFAESIKLGTQAWEENVALTREAEQRYATTESQLAIMRNKLQEVAITFGQILLPPLLAVVEKIGDFADWLANLSPTTQKTIVVIGGLVAALGPALLLIGKMATGAGAVVQAFGTLSAFISKTLIPAITSISLPVVGVVAGIAGLAVIAYEVYRAWDEVKAALSATWEYMKASAEKLALNMSLSFEKMKVTIIGVVDEILERLSILESLPFGIGESFAGLREKVSGSVDASRQKIAELEAALEANSVRMAEAAEDMKVSWGDVGAKVAEDIQLVIDKITGQTEVMAAELEEQTEIVETEYSAQTKIILDEIETQLKAIADYEVQATELVATGAEERTEKVSEEAEKQAQEREKFERQWNEKLFNLQADRLEKLEAEYKAALAMAEELEADKTAIHEYYRILREQYDEEQRKKEEEERKKREAAEKQALERRIAFEEEYQKKLVELTSEGAKSRLEVLGDEYSEALKKAEELGADTTAIHEYYWLLREKVLEEEREAEERAFQERLNLLKSWQDRLIEATATEEELLRIKAEKAIEQIREQMAEEIKLAEGHNEAIAAIRAYWAVEERKVWEEYYEALTASAKKAAEEREALEAEWSNKLLELQLSETEKRLKALDEAEREAIAQAEKVQADITAIQQYYAILRTQIFQEEEKKKQDIARKAQEEREAYEEAWRKKERDRALQAAGDRIQILVQEYLDELKIAEQKGADTAYITRYYQALIAEERQKQAEELAKIAEEEAEKEAKAAEEKLQARQKFEQEWNDKLFKATADRITILERERDEQIRIARELGANTHSIRAYYEKLITDELDRQAKERERRAEEEAKKHQSIWERAGVTIENVCKKIASDFSAMIEHNFNVEQDYVKKREELQEDIKKQLEELDRKRQEELESVGDNAEKKLEIEQKYEALVAEVRQKEIEGLDQLVKARDEQRKGIKDVLKQMLIDLVNALEKELIAEQAASLARAIMRGWWDWTAVLRHGAAMLGAWGAFETAKALIRSFAEGGLVQAGANQLAIIGEGQYDEAVLPLNAAVYSRLAEGITQHMDNSVHKTTHITQNVTIQSPQPLSPAEIARKNRQQLRNLALEWGM